MWGKVKWLQGKDKWNHEKNPVYVSLSLYWTIYCQLFHLWVKIV